MISRSAPRAILAVILLCYSGQSAAFDDQFAAPLSVLWAPPSTPLSGATVTSPVADTTASDGAVLELIYPGGTDASISGPGSAATEVETAAVQGFGTYSARLRPAHASASQGVVSAFFTYFNDGIDHDGDGVIDNHEIDIEMLAAEPAVLYLTVWTEYQADSHGEVFHKNTRKINLATGRMWQTPVGSEGTYDLTEIAPLDWRARGFKAWRHYHTYRFDWQPSQVTYSIDLDDGNGMRTLWTLNGVPDVDIPSHPAPLLLNLWHNAYHWHKDHSARPPRRDVSFRIDWVSLP